MGRIAIANQKCEVGKTASTMDELRTMIDRWGTTFRKMVKSPSKPKAKPKAANKKNRSESILFK